jgi:hypothetical protein
MKGSKNMQTSYIREKNLHFKEEKNKVLILKKDKKTFIELNELGLIIWKLLESKKTVSQIMNKILKEYEGVEKEELKKDVEDFIASCLKNSIIKVSP